MKNRRQYTSPESTVTGTYRGIMMPSSILVSIHLLTSISESAETVNAERSSISESKDSKIAECIR